MSRCFRSIIDQTTFFKTNELHSIDQEPCCVVSKAERYCSKQQTCWECERLKPRDAHDDQTSGLCLALQRPNTSQDNKIWWMGLNNYILRSVTRLTCTAETGREGERGRTRGVRKDVLFCWNVVLQLVFGEFLDRITERLLLLLLLHI